MGSKQLLVVFALVAVFLPTIARATQYVVGDDKGWTTNYDYQLWAQDKVFIVGDSLVFNYTVGEDDVYKVNAAQFKDCIVPPPNEALSSGNDVIELKTPGNKWYISGKTDHCSKGGQKLKITVQSEWAPAPAPPTPYNAASGIQVGGIRFLIAAATALMMAIS